MLRVLIVDDEHLARQAMRRLLAAHPVEIVGEAESVASALKAIESTRPQALFLDIDLGGGDGFDLLAALERPPVVVFVTAYGEHAIRAFEAQAIDYLVKPVDEDRLAATLDRVRQRLSEKRSAGEAERLKEALAEHAPEAAEELGVSIDQLRAMIRSHVVDRDEDLNNVPVTTFQPSDLLILRLLTGKHATS